MAQEKTSKKKTNKVSDAKRHGIQAVWAFLTNSHVSGFVTGKIYTGKLKNVCVPGLNCYSCPGAVGACPIGSLQAVVGSWNFKMAYYVVGFLIFIGAIFGRLICGFLCPFGLIQDLLNKIPFPKKIRTFKGDKLLRKLKYVIFAVFVILLPMFLVDIMGQGSPYFCKLICPAGTLEGGIPLALLNKSMRSALGALYVWKNAILVVTIILSIIIYRPFCKYICPQGVLEGAIPLSIGNAAIRSALGKLFSFKFGILITVVVLSILFYRPFCKWICPLGAIYSLFNKVSFLHITIENSKCVGCNQCSRACKMDIDVCRTPNHPECIRCGACIKACPKNAIHYQFMGKTCQKKDTGDQQSEIRNH